MRILNTIVAVLLAGFITLLAQFYLGSQEQHDEVMAQHFWGELSLRFVFCSVVGLVGAGLWVGLSYGLLKSGFVQHINLRQTTLLPIAGAISGALVGALIFCLS
jgi:hypothetical protein